MPEQQNIEYKSSWHNYRGAHTQIQIYDDRISFWNAGGLPEELTVDLLRKKHSSCPRNPIIAEVCFKGGYIDAWGRGIEKIVGACKEADLPEPNIEESCGGILVTLFNHQYVQGQPESQPESLDVRILALLKNYSLSKSETSNKLGQKRVAGQLNIVIRELLKDKKIELTIPEKPNSRLQKYRLTDKGRLFLKGKLKIEYYSDT